MRWLVGWSSAAAGASRSAWSTNGDGGETPVHPVGSQPLWSGPDPLWAVGDWRPDEIRVVQADPFTRIAVLGCCGATDEELRVALFAARGGALRHLTAWPGGYTAVLQVGRRITVTGDLAGARPVFHTPWRGGTAYATAALPLADLVEAQLDVGHLAALLACPDSPEALRDGTPYMGVRRVPPGHALVLRDGAREITGYEPTASLAVAAPQLDPGQAIDGVRDALVEAVRARLAAPRHAPEAEPADPG
ncbi:asparagine synthase, partial [Streptomyces sp. SID5475]|nr:asparagine synthase [Streptomyces sp. SID5475]